MLNGVSPMSGWVRIRRGWRLVAAVAALCGTATSVDAAALAGPSVQLLNDGWQVRLDPADVVASAEHAPATRWLPAAVPGAVQTDLMAAGLLPDPWVGDNERLVQWVGLSNWEYRRTLVIDAATLARPSVELVFDGLDTLAVVRVNGQEALRADNMHRRWRIPVKGLLHVGSNVVEVMLASPIKALQPKVLAMPHPLPGSYDSAFGDEPLGKQTANYVRKANYQYGWDWAPRVVTLGIWRPVRLEAGDGVRVDDLGVVQVHLDDEAAVVDATVDVQSDAAHDVDVQVDVVGPDGAAQRLTRHLTLYAGMNPVTLPARIAHPQRWWPVGYGAQALYTVTATVSAAGQEIGRLQRAVGLRTTELRRERDAAGRSHTLVVNGVPIFAKGANLVPFDSMPSRVTTARMDAVLEAAVAANMNTLRVWGGGYYPDDAFYATADRLGLLLLQDFMFGGAIPPDDAAFRDNTRLEAVEQVRRLRNHPSVVLWVGNNEVQVSWEKWADRQVYKATLTADEQQRVALGMVRLFDQVLRGAVERNAPGTPYIAGSPSTDYDGPADQMGDGDVHFWDVWVEAPLEDYLTTTPRFMSEFGLQSLPVMRTLRQIVAPDTLAHAPVELKTNGYDAGKGNARLLRYIRANYGEPVSFADYVYLSQVLQAEGLEMAVLHMRSSRPRNMGMLYWTLNDAWPGPLNANWTGAAWGSIDFFGRWKAVHYHARRFYAPLVIAAQRSHGVTDVAIVSDRQDSVAARWRLRLVDRDGALRSERGGPVQVAPLAATPLAHLSDAELLGPADTARTVGLVELLVGDAVVSRSVVYFAAPVALDLVDPHLHTELAAAPGGGYRLTVTARSLARAVWLDTGDLDATLSDNAFDLAPGEARTVDLRSAASLAELRRALSVRSLYGAARRPVAAASASAPK